MAFGRIFIARPQWEDANGNPYVNARLFFYAAGTSTKQNTYTSSAGTTPNSNPMVMNSLGQPNGEVWGDTSLNFKIALAAPGADDPPASFIWVEDDIPTQVSTGGGGGGSASAEEWVTLTGSTLAQTTTTQFTATSDRTDVLHKGRRVKATVTAGTVYGTIVNSVFGSVTTVTLALDSGVLDSGLSAIEYGLLSAVNTSRPQLVDTIDYRVGSVDVTKRIKDEVDALTTATTRTRFHVDEDTSVGGDWGLRNATLSMSVAANALTIALKTKAGTDPSATDPIILQFRSGTATNGDYTTRSITSAFSITVVSGATLGTFANVPHRIYFVAIDNAGTVIPAVYQPVVLNGGLFESHHPISEEDLVGASILDTSSDSAALFYTTVAGGVSSRGMRILGYVEGSQATAGTWASSPTKCAIMKVGTPRPGTIVQRKYQRDGNTNNGATTILFDDSIPQVGEGTAYITNNFAPTNAANCLHVQVEAHFGSGNGGDITMALFRDGVANAIAAKSNTIVGVDEHECLRIQHWVMAGSTASSPFQMRAATQSGATLTFNGRASGRKLGGVMNSFIYIEEVFT